MHFLMLAAALTASEPAAFADDEPTYTLTVDVGGV